MACRQIPAQLVLKPSKQAGLAQGKSALRAIRTLAGARDLSDVAYQIGRGTLKIGSLESDIGCWLLVVSQNRHLSEWGTRVFGGLPTATVLSSPRANLPELISTMFALTSSPG